MTDGNICSSDVWRQISDAQSAVGKLKRKRERCRMERLKFIGKRLVYLLIMLFGVATLVFILTKLVPGDPVPANLSQRALGDPQIVAAYKAKYGLDQPVNTITATDQNGTSVTLYLGSTNSGSDITYAYTSQSDHVYTIASDFADYFKLDYSCSPQKSESSGKEAK